MDPSINDRIPGVRKVTKVKDGHAKTTYLLTLPEYKQDVIILPEHVERITEDLKILTEK